MDETHKRGPKSEYRPKDHPPVSVMLTKLGKRILKAAARRRKLSASNVVEELLRRYGGTL
jgi:hypothetical protein